MIAMGSAFINRTTTTPNLNDLLHNFSDRGFNDTEIKPRTTVAPIQSDVIPLMEKEGIGSLTLNNEYGTIKMSLISAEEEKRRVVISMEKKLTAYKIYSSIGFLSVAALMVFITLGLTNAIGPLSMIVGILFSFVGVVGSIVDWKEWLKKNDSQSCS